MLRFILTLLSFFTFTAIALAQQPSVIDLMMRIRPCIVEVIADNAAAKLNSPQQKSLYKDPATGKIMILDRGATLATYQRNGAGVIIDPSGVIVTNAHTINQAERVEVMLVNGERLNASVVRFAKDLDLALLKINVPVALQSVPIADSSQIMLNTEIFSLGSSPLLKESISGGRITGLASSQNAVYSNGYESDFFRTSMNIYKGDSGGPLFNRAGELIGLMTAKLLSQDSSSFAVSSNKIRRYLDAYLKDVSNKK